MPLKFCSLYNYEKQIKEIKQHTLSFGVDYATSKGE